MDHQLKCRRGLTRFVRLHPGDLPVGEEQDAVRDILDAGIVRDDQRRGAELRIDAQQRLDDANACLGIQRAVGSSQSSTSGRFAIARAMATRCCSPPESWDGK